MIYKYHVSLSVAHSNVPFIYREFRFCLLCLEENPTSHLGYKRNANFVAIYWTNWQLVSHVIGYQENISALVIFLSLTLAPLFGGSFWLLSALVQVLTFGCLPPLKLFELQPSIYHRPQLHGRIKRRTSRLLCAISN